MLDEYENSIRLPTDGQILGTMQSNSQEGKCRNYGEMTTNKLSASTSSSLPLPNANCPMYCDENDIVSTVTADTLPKPVVEPDSDHVKTNQEKHKIRSDSMENISSQNQAAQVGSKWQKEMQHHSASSRNSFTDDTKSTTISTVSSSQRADSKKKVGTSNKHLSHETKNTPLNKGNNTKSSSDQLYKKSSIPGSKTPTTHNCCRLYDLAREKQIREKEKTKLHEVSTMQSNALSSIRPKKIACSVLVDLYERGMIQKAKMGKIRSPVKHQQKVSTAARTTKRKKTREETSTTISSSRPVSSKNLKERATSNLTEYSSKKEASDKQKESVFDRLYNRSKRTNNHTENYPKISTPTKKNLTDSPQRKEIISASQLYKPNIQISQRAVPSPCHNRNQNAFERLYQQMKPILAVASMGNSVSVNSLSQQSDQRSFATKSIPCSPNIRASQRTVPSPTCSKTESAFDRLYKQSLVMAAKKTEQKLRLDGEGRKSLKIRSTLNHDMKKSLKKPNPSSAYKPSIPKTNTLIDFLFHPSSIAKMKPSDLSNCSPSDDILLPEINTDDPSHIVRPNYGFTNNDHNGSRNSRKSDFISDSDSDSVSALLAKGGYIEPNFERIESPHEDSESEYSHLAISEINTCGRISVSSDISLGSM